MVLRKRKKFTNTRTAHNQHGKRHRGSGNRGGVGRAGAGKRGKQKKQSFLDLGKYVLKPKSKLKSINISELPKDKEVVLKGFKLLGRGSGFKSVIKVSAATERAVKKITEAGGKIEILK
ncbi:MAG: hypothetical protein GON13_00285 [Nanoarchaeota archaeon]|nr:hypothetical protein [Nanoarchaeota archaeon]